MFQDVLQIEHSTVQHWNSHSTQKVHANHDANLKYTSAARGLLYIP